MWGIYGVHKCLWFSAELGWVEEDKATRYTWEQKEATQLPFGGVWKKQLRPVDKTHRL